MTVEGPDQGMGDLMEDRVAHVSLVVELREVGTERDRVGAETAYAGSGLGAVGADAPVAQPVLAQQAAPEREGCRNLHDDDAASPHRQSSLTLSQPLVRLVV